MTIKKLIYLFAIFFTGLIAMQSCSSDDDCTQQTYFQDADGDGFGNSSNSQQSCTQPTGFVTDNTDFDDSNASAFPNATEVCNGVDDNGDGTIDEDPSSCGAGEVCENGSCVTAVTYYLDADGDGFGDPSNTLISGSTAPNGYVTDNTDCDDSDDATNPDAPENTTDGVDNNCNGNVDECVPNVRTVTECSCTDAIDNDFDGLTDCADDDCTGMSGC